jgi:hypothetical protein
VLSPRLPRWGLCSSPLICGDAATTEQPRLGSRPLESRTDVVTKQVGDNEVELSLLGSYNEDAAQMTVDLLVRAWQASRDDGATVELVD